MRRLVPFALALSLATAASAGVVVEYKQTDGKTTTDGKAWLGADRLRVESGNSVIIFRGDQDVVRTWQVGEKTYTELTKAEMKEMSDMMSQAQAALASLPPEQRAMAEKMMAAHGGGGAAKAAAPAPEPVTFVATGKTETINGWACTSYDAKRAGKTEGEYWATPFDQFGLKASDFDVFQDLQDFMRELGGPFAAKMDSTYAQRYGDGGLPGPPIRVITTRDGVTSTHEITKLTREDVPASTFELPSGMTKRDMGMKGRG